MGLGAWIHGSISPPVLMGDPKFIKQYGPMLGFDFVIPKWKLIDAFRWQTCLPKYANLRANAGRAAPQGRAPDQGQLSAVL